ncbi:PREDICTED: uncharacterized protein LOC106821424 [Priapulus caudatus]|uniref:Uncharacterized protein LOC106821424 n=1 Tax=Priapulus caudatus TaxID=37621 RepID=A0ABM1FB77_PRICU|nr:PREDICTED: uncharacterized protein LOC106821424 [Priapulus caudatus]
MVASRQGLRRMSAVGEHHGPLLTLNDLPVPKGSWSVANAKRQSKMNMQLISSVVAFSLTVGYMIMENIVYLNPPPRMTNPPLDILKS